MKTLTKFTPLLLRLHRWGGLVAALFFLVLAGTGCVMAFESEIDSFFHPSLIKVIPEGAALSLGEILPHVAAELRPQEHVQACVTSAKPTSSYSFTIVGSSRLPRQIFVNQYTGRVLGTMSVVRFVPVMHALHEANGTLMGCAAACLVLSVLSGLYLWWPLKRIKISMRGSRTRLYFDTHNSVGFFTSLFLFVFALTGAYMAFDSWTVPATYRITGTSLPQDDPPSTPLEHVKPVTPDYAVEVAKKTLSQAIPLWVVLPQEREASYLVKMKFPEDPTNGASIVWVDQYSGKVLTVWDSRNAPLARRIQNLNRVFHTGEILGLPGKTLACVVSFALAVQTLTGFSLWRKTRRQKTSLSSPSVPG